MCSARHRKLLFFPSKTVTTAKDELYFLQYHRLTEVHFQYKWWVRKQCPNFKVETMKLKKKNMLEFKKKILSSVKNELTSHYLPIYSITRQPLCYLTTQTKKSSDVFFVFLQFSVICATDIYLYLSISIWHIANMTSQ